MQFEEPRDANVSMQSVTTTGKRRVEATGDQMVLDDQVHASIQSVSTSGNRRLSPVRRALSADSIYWSSEDTVVTVDKDG